MRLISLLESSSSSLCLDLGTIFPIAIEEDNPCERDAGCILLESLVLTDFLRCCIAQGHLNGIRSVISRLCSLR